MSLDKFNQVYELSKIDEDKLNKINGLIKGITIEVAFGQWCSDSIENVPRLIKILDKIDFDFNYVKFINIDKKKEKVNWLIKDKDIKRLPTIIFIKDKKEIGRIIENPSPTLEDNIIDILNKK